MLGMPIKTRGVKGKKIISFFTMSKENAAWCTLSFVVQK